MAENAVQSVRPLNVIATEIRSDWSSRGKGVNYAAAPYLDAMEQLTDVHGKYYADSAASIVRYFLANAGSWRGDKARAVKAELNLMIKDVY